MSNVYVMDHPLIQHKIGWIEEWIPVLRTLEL